MGALIEDTAVLLVNIVWILSAFIVVTFKAWL